MLKIVKIINKELYQKHKNKTRQRENSDTREKKRKKKREREGGRKTSIVLFKGRNGKLSL